MKKFYFLLLSLTCFSLVSIAQHDTTFLYFNKAGAPSTKEAAETIYTIAKVGNVYQTKEYKAKNHQLIQEGSYLEPDFKKPNGTFKNYRDNGTLDYTAEYENGLPKSKLYYYEDGKKLASIIYGDKNTNEQKGWDKSGNEIKNYIAEKEAMFKGGANGWKKYLEKNLNANVAADAGAPAGDYTVVIKFVVDKEGNVSNVKADSIPAKCKPCALEALHVIRDGPAWEPAIQNSRPVIYQAIQYITFRVEEQKKKGGKS